jgi:hypothetical protein
MAPSTEYTRVEDTNEDHGGEGLLKRDDKHSSVHSGHVSTNKSDDILQSQHEIFLQWGLGSDGSGNITPLEEHEPAGASVGNWDDSYKTDQSTSSGVSEGQVQNKTVNIAFSHEKAGGLSWRCPYKIRRAIHRRGTVSTSLACSGRTQPGASPNPFSLAACTLRTRTIVW